MRTEVAVDGSASPAANYIGWSPRRATMRLSAPSGAPGPGPAPPRPILQPLRWTEGVPEERRAIWPYSGTRAPGGLSLDAARGLIGQVAAHARIRAASFASYDPSCDAEGRIAAAAVSLARELAGGLD